jgi:NADH-quinone oxidoreductase subunit D
VMLTELTRLNSHLVWLGTHAIDIGAMSVFLYCFREREEILKIFEMFSGQRMMTSYFRIGGLALGPPRGWQQRVKKFVGGFPAKVDEYENLLTNNRIWTGRTKGVGYISLEDMLDLGVTGPMLRAAGLKIDARKDQPYSSYEKFDFEVPTRTENDVYARYLVRIEEMRQSNRIVGQCSDWLHKNPGPVIVDNHKVAPPDRESMKSNMEELIHHFKLFTEGMHVPPGEAYAAIEHPKGEFGVYIISDGANKPYRVKLRAPDYVHLAALDEMSRGHMIADVVAIIGSQDIVFGSIDR